MGFSSATPARGCSDGPTPGALALEVAVLERAGELGVHSLGIFNCRRVAGTNTWSVHAEGRALDLGVTGADPGAGHYVLGLLLAAGDGLLQQIMYDHRIYDARSPLGRPISGSNPHTDHLHVEMSWPGARGEISLELPDEPGNEEAPMPGLLVEYRGAQFAVSLDLTSKVGLSRSEDVRALLTAGYKPVVLTETLMSSIPNG